MKRTAKIVLTLLWVCLLTGCASKGTEEKGPVKVVLWHYYNDSQKEQLDELIAEYNRTLGEKKGIRVEAYGQGSVDELSEKVDLILNHSTNELTSMDMFLTYRDMAARILTEQPDRLVDYRNYFTEEELTYYNEDYLREGYFGERLHILPLAKSTELLLMNQDRLDEFQKANPSWDKSSLQTWEGLAESARLYYEWTDGMTPDVLHDGQAFIGMDVPANYFIVLNHSLGSSIYSYEDGQLRFDLQEDIIGEVFDNYYIPYTKGYYGAYGRYRSDDLRQSLLAGYIGSSSSIAYFPQTVLLKDGEEKEIHLGIYEYPYKKDGVRTAVQQGAGAAVVAGDERREEACIDFLKWLTQEKGLAFAASMSYMPACREALSEEQLQGIGQENNRQGIITGMRQSRECHMVYGFDFEKGYETRQELTDYILTSLNAGRAEFSGYLEQGMSMEEASEAIAYPEKRADFYRGIVQIFEEAG